MKFGNYEFVNRDKLRRAQKRAGEGADVEAIAKEYLVLGGLLRTLKGEVVKEIAEKKKEKEKKLAKKEVKAKK